MGSSRKPTLYMFGLFDFGGGADASFAVVGPKGRTGRLHDYGVQGVIEALHGGTLNPRLVVGTAGDDDAYGTTFTPTPDVNTTGDTVRQRCKHVTEVATYILPAALNLPADTAVILKCLAATGSALTGQAYPVMEIEWAD